jgi:hypothetical protein
MLVRIEDTSTTLDLGEFLGRRDGAIVDLASTGELEVSLIGSYSVSALRAEIEDAVSRWMYIRRRPDALVVVG